MTILDSALFTGNLQLCSTFSGVLFNNGRVSDGPGPPKGYRLVSPPS